MRKVRLSFLLIAFLLVLGACQKEESPLVDEQKALVEDKMQEPDLEVTAEVVAFASSVKAAAEAEAIVA